MAMDQARRQVRGRPHDHSRFSTAGLSRASRDIEATAGAGWLGSGSRSVPATAGHCGIPGISYAGGVPVHRLMLTLEGAQVRLEPLTLAHLDALCEIGLDDDLWRWIPKPVHSREDMQDYIQTALQWQSDGTAIPFVTLERSTGRVVGSTRFMNIDRPNRHVEIGATWLARPWQRTVMNTEAKYLMLRHAFEQLVCIP